MINDTCLELTALAQDHSDNPSRLGLGCWDRTVAVIDRTDPRWPAGLPWEAKYLAVARAGLVVGTWWESEGEVRAALASHLDPLGHPEVTP